MSASPFMILGLPRCRTAWLAHFLSYPLPSDGRARRCGHDIAIDCGSVDDLLNAVQPGQFDGTVETGTVIAWKLIRAKRPDIRIIAIRRPVKEIVASLDRLGFTGIESIIAERAAMIEDMIETDASVRSLTFADLDSPFVCKWLFEYCLGLFFDQGWYAALRSINVQANVAEVVARLSRNHRRIEAMKRDVADAVRTIECAA